MAELTLPASPNWYCSRIMDINDSGIVVFGARQDVHVLSCTEIPPVYLGVFGLHRDRVSSVALSPHSATSTLCSSASEDGKVKIWDTRTKVLQHEHSVHNGKVAGLSWSAVQEDLIVSGDDKGELIVWQLHDNRIQTFCPEKAAIFCLAFSPCSTGCVAVGYRTGVIVLVDVKKEGSILQRLRGHDEDVMCVVWCPVPGEDFTSKDTPDFGDEGYLLASGSRDRTIRLWSTSKGRQLNLLKLPKPGGNFQRDQEGGRGKQWTTLVWNKLNPLQIISGSSSGELFLWELGKEGQQKPEPFSLQNRRLSHNRVVFNLCLSTTNILCSVSMDRQVIFWNLEKCSPICALPTLGGFVYAAKTSPVDPGRLAFGVGDCMIRLWNLNNKGNIYDVTCLWQGIKTKVTAISWHPIKEGLLAYGTDDGRVGIYDTLSNKPPNISCTYHRRTVYVVAWGPPCGISEEEVNSSYVVYSVGDGIIRTHNPSKLHDEAKDVNTIIQDTNGQKPKLPIRSEISWSPDFSLLAVGNDDGSVEVYHPPNLNLVCTVHVHKKLINSIYWHPHLTSSSPISSPYKHWIASGSNESAVHVVDLSSILGSLQSSSEPVVVSTSKRTLLGHAGRITGVAWSPHTDGLLASVSYDGQAKVWDVDKGQLLASFTGHDGKLLCVVWSGTDPDIVFTGADDFSLHKWKISTHPPSLEDNTQKRRQPKKRNKFKKSAEVPTSSNVDSAVVRGNQADNNSPDVDDTNGGRKQVDYSDIVTFADDDKENLESLLERKKQELLNYTALNQTVEDQQANENESDRKEDVSVSVDREDCRLSNYSTSVPTQQSSVQTTSIDQTKAASDGHRESYRFTKSDFNKDKKKKAWRPKSFFPVLNKFENKSRESVLEDIVTLTKYVFGETKIENNSNCNIDHENTDDEDDNIGDDENDFVHLGLFLDRRAMYRCLKQEGQYHRDHDNMDYFYQLEIWKGNINGALRLAREREELSDWLVAMAPMAAFDTWITICEDYATQLESDGQYHKAATYLLAAHKVYGAIELFKRHRLFKEAIALAKVRLSPFDPVLEDLYMLWAHQLTKDGNYEQAAKCHLAMKQVQDAALLLARRYSQSSLQTATRISLIANEKQQALVYGQKVIQANLLRSEWNEAYTFLKDQKHLQALMAVSGMHELLIKEVSSCNPDILSVDQEKFTKWDDSSNQKSVLPDFILDADETDPVLPWQPHLVDGHTFPHHVLRIWYGNLGITMDTASIEEMYKALSVLHAGRQVQSEIQQLLVGVSIDLVLCMLSLLMSETPTAISHLLQAVSSLHEAEHHLIMEILLRRFLPQGPKYILKLQQEVTAMRVVISMESSSNFDGASKVHTIKRYLSELKEEDSVSNGGLRCRELDCLRAYYYLSILYFLGKKTQGGEATTAVDSEIPTSVKNVVDSDLDREINTLMNPESNTTVEIVSDSNATSVQPTQSKEKKDEKCEGETQNENVENQIEKTRCSNGDITSDDKRTNIGLGNSDVSVPTEVESESNINSDTIKSSNNQSIEKSDLNDNVQKPVKDKNTRVDNYSDGESLDKMKEVNEKGASKVSDSVEISNSLGKDRSDNVENKLCVKDTEIKAQSSCSPNIHENSSGNKNHGNNYQITITKLSHLSRGLLWDMQGKRYALTETLGYIHKAISQLLLAQRPSSLSSAQNESAQTDTGASELPQARGNNFVSTDSIPGEIGEVTSPLERLAFQDNFSGIEHSCKKRHHSEPVLPLPNASEASSVIHHDSNCPMISRSLSTDTGDNQSFDIHIPHHGHHLCVSSLEEMESNSGLFDLCSSCELITKSRKVLWEDEPRFHFESSDHGKGKLTSIVNPAKYINVPDEWYNMAADQKYSMPYVTMAILKEEQEYMMHELKRGPDAIQVPFPNPMDSVKILLNTCNEGDLPLPEKSQFAEKVITWAMKFSVSSQQKDMLMESLHKIQTHSD